MVDHCTLAPARVLHSLLMLIEAYGVSLGAEIDEVLVLGPLGRREGRCLNRRDCACFASTAVLVDSIDWAGSGALCVVGATRMILLFCSVLSKPRQRRQSDNQYFMRRLA